MVPKIKPIIIWQKWVDPFEPSEENNNNEWEENIDDEDLEDNEEYDSIGEAEPPMHNSSKIYAISTPMGIIPYNEYTDCTKIFNFWIGHTNFSITEYVADIIKKTAGIETLDVFTRYRFRVSFGKAFNSREIMNDIKTQIEVMDIL
jgi:hypothetical protein